MLFAKREECKVHGARCKRASMGEDILPLRRTAVELSEQAADIPYTPPIARDLVGCTNKSSL